MRLMTKFVAVPLFLLTFLTSFAIADANSEFAIAESTLCSAYNDVSMLPQVPNNPTYESLRLSALDLVSSATFDHTEASVWLEDANYWRLLALQWRMANNKFQESVAKTKCNISEQNSIEASKRCTQSSLSASAYARNARNLLFK